MTHNITVKEIREYVMEIEAETREEALKLAEEEYWEHITDYDYLLEPKDTLFE